MANARNRQQQQQQKQQIQITIIKELKRGYVRPDKVLSLQKVLNILWQSPST